jgi:hypothetical protein
MEYKISGHSKRYLDSGSGGLPIMIHASKSTETNSTYRKTSREISVCPLECPSESTSGQWWDEETNGNLVLKRTAINAGGRSLVDWSKDIPLDTVGTTDEINCREFLFTVKVRHSHRPAVDLLCFRLTLTLSWISKLSGRLSCGGFSP